MGTPAFTDNARRIFDLRFPRKDEEGNPAESPAETIHRVTSNVAIATGFHVGLVHPKGASWDAAQTMSDEVYPGRTMRRAYEWYTGHDKALRAPLHLILGHGRGAYMVQQARYENMITNLLFLPNSPTWTGAGTPLGQLAACFVLPVRDDLGRASDSIYSTLRNAALIQQTGGGNGFDFSTLRPRKALISTSMGQASGPMGFAKVYNGAFKELAQGGSRRGANMLVMRVDHPNVEDFIKAKVREGEFDQFNFSVAITDRFMEAVDKDEDFDLGFGGKVYETVRAVDLFDLIVDNAWVIGDPGNLFVDRANRDNPCPTRYRLASTNPCGEQWLGPYENCCLGSIAVQRFVKKWYLDRATPTVHPYGTFDWDGFAETIHTATQFLDDVIDANQYVADVPELAEAAQGGRRIGLGLMGVADAMAMMGVRYGSKEGLDFLSQLTEFARYETMLASIERAKERGPFPWIKDSIYDPALLVKHGPGAVLHQRLAPSHQDYSEGDPVRTIPFHLWSRPTAMVDHDIDFGRPSLDWSLVEQGIKNHGIRNSCQFTFAPTGTISNVGGCEGSGCEPFFALAFTRTVMQEEENIKLAYASDLFEQALLKVNYSKEQVEAIAAEVAANGGSCQDIEGIEDLARVFVTAADVTPEEHVWTQAVLQRWVDNSISKTINLPNSATRDDVAAAYKLAFELGCKGITVYRQGSRELEVLSTKSTTAENVEKIEQGAEVMTAASQALGGWPEVHPLPIPQNASIEGLPARVFPVGTFYGKVQVTITEHPDHPGRPFDVRLQVGKAGNDTAAHVEALGRMISLTLRAGVPVKEVVDQLIKIGGQSVHGFGPNRVTSVADGVAKLLQRLYLFEEVPEGPVVFEEVKVTSTTHSPDGTEMTVNATSQVVVAADPDMLCPNCKNASLVMEGGCRHCDIRLGGCGLYEGCE